MDAATGGTGQGDATAGGLDPLAPIALLLTHLRAGPDGLGTREAARRLEVDGPNLLVRRSGPGAGRELVRQLTHPLALLLWAAAVLSVVSGSAEIAVAIVVVIVINAVFAFVQERHAERAVEALGEYLPERAVVYRDGRRQLVAAADLVVGDVVLLAEGDRVPADVRLLDGGLEVDLSALTGESLPGYRDAEFRDTDVPLTQARDLVFSGTSCTSGEARGIVFATGMRTELGRIAALSQRVGREESPLERQVRDVARLIAIVSVAAGAVFVPVGMFAAGLPPADAVTFAIALIAANVPEGLLPTITLALAVAVRELADAGALVKRLSAAETLGATTVVCTDKTGTLTLNRMRVTDLWTADGRVSVPWQQGHLEVDTSSARVARLLTAVASCNDADLGVGGEATGDPTEIALLEAAAAGGVDVSVAARERRRRVRFHFDAARRLMASVDEDGNGLVVFVKGAPEAVLPRCVAATGPSGARLPLDDRARASLLAQADTLAHAGLRVLAVAERSLDGDEVPRDRDAVERDLTALGLVAMVDPPRPEVPAAVAACRTAGIRIIVISGDAPGTVARIAQQVGIVGAAPTVVTGEELDRLPESDLDALFADERDLLFARSSPESKLRITDALRAVGEVVAMTGDGVNDAPALRRADVGVAMGRSGTEVARQAATMVLVDDDFATIVAAVEAGRRVYANVRKFVCYIFAHLTPEVVPILVYALAGGAIPLPLTVLQILAIDLGTELLPALALGREPSEPGIMDRPPRSRAAKVIDRSLAWRAWGFLGAISSVLVMAGFFATLLAGGWTPGADTGAGAPLAALYRQATTMTFAGIVACQIGTAVASRTEWSSLRTVGVASNPLLLWSLAAEVVFLVALVNVPVLQDVFGTAPLAPAQWLVLATFPVVVWGSDEYRRARRRRLAAPDAGQVTE